MLALVPRVLLPSQSESLQEDPCGVCGGTAARVLRRERGERGAASHGVQRPRRAFAAPRARVIVLLSSSSQFVAGVVTGGPAVVAVVVVVVVVEERLGDVGEREERLRATRERRVGLRADLRNSLGFR